MRIARYVLSVTTFGPIGAWAGYIFNAEWQDTPIEGITIGAFVGVLLGLLAAKEGLLNFVFFTNPFQKEAAQGLKNDFKRLPFLARPWYLRKAKQTYAIFVPRLNC